MWLLRVANVTGNIYNSHHTPVSMHMTKQKSFYGCLEEESRKLGRLSWIPSTISEMSFHREVSPNTGWSWAPDHKLHHRERNGRTSFSVLDIRNVECHGFDVEKMTSNCASSAPPLAPARLQGHQWGFSNCCHLLLVAICSHSPLPSFKFVVLVTSFSLFREWFVLVFFLLFGQLFNLQDGCSEPNLMSSFLKVWKPALLVIFPLGLVLTNLYISNVVHLYL